MKKIWYTSDSHYAHKNITGPSVSSWSSGFRDFKSTEEMNQTLVKTLNKYVGEEDILYHLGDWSFGGQASIWDFRRQILCKEIHLVLGNHDDTIRHNKPLPDTVLKAQEIFTSVQEVLTVKHGKHAFFLSHYAHRIWMGSHKGVIHLYGHNHGTLSDYGKSMDVGVDVAYKMFGEYRPFRIEEIINIMDKKQIEYPDHHNPKTNIK